MKKIVITFGLIAGGIVSAVMIIGIVTWNSDHSNFDNSELVGYASMIIALSMVFFGIKSFRDNHAKGTLTFGKGVQIGLLISLIASLMYFLTWEIYYQSDSDLRENFMNRYTEHVVNKMKEKGASAEEVEKTRKQMSEMGEMYKNPFIRFGMTLVEILPVGIAITLISATILRKKAVLPET